MIDQIINAKLTIGLMIRAALLCGVLFVLLSSDVQAQAPNSGVSIYGQLTMARSDGPQIRLNDTRFPTSGDGATMRGASGGLSTGMVLVERAGGAGGVYLILQPVGAVDSGNALGYVAYGVGGLGNPTSTNINLAYYNVNPPYYFMGTSTANGASPCAPLRIWSMNHVPIIFECPVGGVQITRIYDPLVFDDSNLPVAPAESRLEMSRLQQARADQGGLSWPIVWKVPTWNGEMQVVKTLKQQAFGSNTGGANAVYGLRFSDNEGNVLAEVSTSGLWLRLGGVLKQVTEGPPDSGGPGRRTLTVAN